MALSPTYYYTKAASGSGMDQGDIHRSIFNMWKAIAAICYNLDEDAATLGTDYMSCIGTDLNTAMAAWKTPTGKNL